MPTLRHFHVLNFLIGLMPLHQAERVPTHFIKHCPKKREDTYLVSCLRYAIVQLVTENLSLVNVRFHARGAIGLR